MAYSSVCLFVIVAVLKLFLSYVHFACVWVSGLLEFQTAVSGRVGAGNWSCGKAASVLNN